MANIICGLLWLLSFFRTGDRSYRDLFNGRDLSGWKDVYGPTDSWSVEGAG